MSYLEALYHFVFERQPLDQIHYSKKILVFVGASGIMAILMILLDFACFYLKRKSYLGMHYNAQSKYWLILLTWTLGSLIVSCLGFIMNIFNDTLQSCVVVGASWMYFFAKIANQKSEPEVIQE